MELPILVLDESGQKKLQALDNAPLNLAHFNERRADKFMRHGRYDEALDAIETSLSHLEEAYQNVTIPKSIEILDSQKWDFERKRREIQLRRNQQDRLKSKDSVVPLTESNFRPENINTKQSQSLTTSIDQTKINDLDVKYCEDLDAKKCDDLNAKYCEDLQLQYCEDLNLKKYCENFETKCEDIDAKYCEDLDAKYCELIMMSKENLNPRASSEADIDSSSTTESEPDVRRVNKKLRLKKRVKKVMKKVEEAEELPTLVPLDLPEFDFSMFASRPLLPSVNTLAESFPK